MDQIPGNLESPDKHCLGLKYDNAGYAHVKRRGIVKARDKNRDKKYEEDLIKCVGKYVAVSNRTVIACGRSIGEVKRAAAKKNVERPVIFPVPKNAGKLSFF